MQIQQLEFELEIRDITTRDDWFQAYQYEIPVLWLESSASTVKPILLPRPSPRATVSQLTRMLQNDWSLDLDRVHREL
jgi:hypothetical protein